MADRTFLAVDTYLVIGTYLVVGTYLVAFLAVTFLVDKPWEHPFDIKAEVTFLVDKQHHLLRMAFLHLGHHCHDALQQLLLQRRPPQSDAQSDASHHLRLGICLSARRMKLCSRYNNKE